MRRQRIPSTHEVRCQECRARFDLFVAKWCDCSDPHMTKVCPECESCLCQRAGRGDPDLWVAPPEEFRRHGFIEVPVYYL